MPSSRKWAYFKLTYYLNGRYILLPLAAFFLAVDIGSCQVNTNGPRCVSTENALNDSTITPECAAVLTSKNTLLLPLDYSSLNKDLSLLAHALEAADTDLYCDQATRAYVCNYIFLPCDNASNAVGICREDCRHFILEDNFCSDEFNFLVGLSSQTGITFPKQCDNTLLLLDMTGVNVSRSKECFKVQELIDATTPPRIELPSEPNLLLILSLTIAAVVIVLCFGILIGVIYRLSRKKRAIKRKYQLSQNHLPMQNMEEELFEISPEDALNNPKLKADIVSFHCVKILDKIGHGAFGNVYKGIYTPQSNKPSVEVAVKTIKNSSASYSELKGFLEESVIMCGFDHPHVLGLIGICLDPSNSPHLLLPFMENGDLKTYLLKQRTPSSTIINDYPKGLEYNVLLKMCLDIAQGMKYLSAKKLVHRDLAARNCMLDGSLNVRVADFGLTRDIYETDYYRQSQQGRVPVKWMAPESLHDRISNEKTDVWSYGVTCWEVFSLGRTPYPTVGNTEMITYLERGRRLQKPLLCSNPMYEAMKSCWHQEPQERLGFTALCTLLQSDEFQKVPSSSEIKQERYVQMSSLSLRRMNANNVASNDNSYLELVESSASRRGEAKTKSFHRNPSKSFNNHPTKRQDSEVVTNPRAHSLRYKGTKF